MISMPNVRAHCVLHEAVSPYAISYTWMMSFVNNAVCNIVSEYAENGMSVQQYLWSFGTAQWFSMFIHQMQKALVERRMQRNK